VTLWVVDPALPPPSVIKSSFYFFVQCFSGRLPSSFLFFLPVRWRSSSAPPLFRVFTRRVVAWFSGRTSLPLYPFFPCLRFQVPRLNPQATDGSSFLCVLRESLVFSHGGFPSLFSFPLPREFVFFLCRCHGIRPVVIQPGQFTPI